MPQNSAASVRIDKDLRRAKHRRALREAFLQKLNVGQDESRIRALVKQYLELARSSGEQVVKAKGNRELLHEFFKDAVALFLLASERRSLASKLMSVLYGQHKDRVRKHVNTTLLAFILKTLGPLSAARAADNTSRYCCSGVFDLPWGHAQ
jgi:GTP1/Obg family GTP-binding protein